MSGIVRGRSAWCWWWLAFASHVGVDPELLGDRALLEVLRARR